MSDKIPGRAADSPKALRSKEKKKREEVGRKNKIENILVQTDARRVFVDEKEVELKNKEYELLVFLMSNTDIIFSKETLYERI